MFTKSEVKEIVSTQNNLSKWFTDNICTLSHCLKPSDLDLFEDEGISFKEIFNNKIPIRIMLSDNIEILKYLVSKGIEIDTRNNIGKLIAGELVDNKAYKVLEYFFYEDLLNERIKEEVLLDAIRLNDIKVVELFIKHNTRNRKMFLHMALGMAYNVSNYTIMKLILNNIE